MQRVARVFLVLAVLMGGVLIAGGELVSTRTQSVHVTDIVGTVLVDGFFADNGEVVLSVYSLIDDEWRTRATASTVDGGHFKIAVDWSESNAQILVATRFDRTDSGQSFVHSARHVELERGREIYPIALGGGQGAVVGSSFMLSEGKAEPVSDGLVVIVNAEFPSVVYRTQELSHGKFDVREVPLDVGNLKAQVYCDGCFGEEPLDRMDMLTRKAITIFVNLVQ